MIAPRPVWLVLAMCLILACLSHDAGALGAPILIAEIAFLAVGGFWSTRLLMSTAQSAVLARVLATDSEAAERFGIPFQRVRLSGRGAFVLGSARPTIYVSGDLEDVLAPGELLGVLLHEDHHRAIRAPLRAAALHAWLSVFRPVRPIRAGILQRLADLESLADAHALANGVAPSTLASALVKSAGTSTAGYAGSGFGEAAETRITTLLALAAGHGKHRASAPVEWLPAVAVVVLLVACHIVGFPIPA